MSENIARYVIDPLNFNGVGFTAMKDGVHCDYYHTTIEELRERDNNPNLIAITVARFEFLEKRYLKALQLPFEEITEERYDYFLDCVPPRRFSGGSFFVGECYDGNLHTFCFELNGKFYQALRPINLSSNKLNRQMSDFRKHLSFRAKLVKGDTITDDGEGLYDKKLDTPYLFEGRDGKSHLIHNLISKTNDPDANKAYRDDMMQVLRDLRKYNYEYIPMIGGFNNLFGFFEWIQKNKYTIEILGMLFRVSENRDYIDFYGRVNLNLKFENYAKTFLYRIYDRDTLQHVINLLRTVKREFVWKR